jgi:hypothetical protein
MALDDTFTITPPNQWNGAGPVDALVIEEFTGMVEGTIERRSLLVDKIPFRSIKGTDTFTNRAVGGAGPMRVVTPGAQLDGVKSEFARNAVTVDTVVAQREAFGLLDVFLTNIDVRREVATEQGKEIAKFTDQTLFIQAIKAALLTQSTYKGSAANGKPKGHFGGSQETLALAGDLSDPAKLYAAIARLLVKMERKDVDPRNDDIMIIVRPDEYYTLIQAEQLVNTQYLSASGNSYDAWVLKTYGVPVWSSNNCPFLTNVTGHQYSNGANGNAYDGDFSKVAALAFAPKAIMAGEAIPVQSDIFYDKLHKSWFVDSHLSFAAGPNRAEFAAAVLLP